MTAPTASVEHLQAQLKGMQAKVSALSAQLMDHMTIETNIRTNFVQFQQQHQQILNDLNAKIATLTQEKSDMLKELETLRNPQAKDVAPDQAA